MIRFLLSLLAARREAAELRVLLDCAQADLGSLRRELAASQDARARLIVEKQAAEADAREANGRLSVLVAERDHALVELHRAETALKRAEKTARDRNKARR